MTYATFHWAVVMRINESSTLPDADTADFTLDYWVTGADSAARKLNAENCAKEQCKNMLNSSNTVGGITTSRTTVVLSSSQIGTR